MLTKILAGLTLVAGFTLAGTAYFPAASADVQQAGVADCCQKNLACCTESDNEAPCCVADVKLGCCEKGLACCAEDKDCCHVVQECCLIGAECCDEAKACCGPSPKTSDRT